MSLRVMVKVFEESDETLARRLILLALAEVASDDGIAWPGQEKIAAKARLSRTHVTERIGEMIEDGVIELRKAQVGRRRINVYRLILPGLDEPNHDRLPFKLDRPFAMSEVPTPSEATTSDPPSDDVGSTDLTTSEVPTSRARDPLPEPRTRTLSEDPSSLALTRSDVEEDSSKPPKLTKVDGRDLAFDTLAEVCGVDPRGNRSRDVGVALNGSARGEPKRGIRELAWSDALLWSSMRDPARPDYRFYPPVGEEFERWLADRIRSKAESYHRTMPRGSLLTPFALAKYWTDVEKAATSRDPAAAAFAEAQRLAEQGR